MGPDDSVASEISDASSSSVGSKTARKRKVTHKLRKNLNRTLHPHDKTKRMISGLTKNNRELAKRLENSEVTIAEQHKQLQYFHEKINHVICMNTKVQEAMIKMNTLAANLNDVVSTLSEVREYARKAVGAQDREEEHTLTLTMKVPMTGLDQVPNNNPQYNVKTTNLNAEKMHMSVIDEDASRLLFEESPLSPDSISDSEESPKDIRKLENVAVVASDRQTRSSVSDLLSELISPTLPKITCNGSSRRRSGLVLAANKTPPRSDQAPILTSGSQTPKPPVLLSDLPKSFKSNIPKPLSKAKSGGIGQSGRQDQCPTDDSTAPTNENDAGGEPANAVKAQRKRLSRKPGELLQPQSSSANEEINEMEPKKARFGIGTNGKEVTSQVNTRRRTFILQNNGNRNTDAVDSQTATNPDDRRKTFVMPKDNEMSTTQENKPEKALQSSDAKRKTFCVQKAAEEKSEVKVCPDPENPSVHPTTDISQTQAVEDQLPSYVSASGEQRAGSRNDIQAQVSTDSVSKNPFPSGLDLVPDSLTTQKQTTTTKAASSQEVAPLQMFNATVYNVEDMELTDVFRVPIAPIVTQQSNDLIVAEDGNGKAGDIPKSLPVASVDPSPSSADNDSQTSNKDPDTDCNAVLDSVVQPSEGIVEQKFVPEVAGEAVSDDVPGVPVSADNGGGDESESSVLPVTAVNGNSNLLSDKKEADKCVTPSAGGLEIEKEGEEQVSSSGVRVKLILMKKTQLSKGPSINPSIISPPVNANDPCCSKSLTPGMTRIRKRNPRFRDFFSPFSSQDSDEDSDFEPSRGKKLPVVPKRSSMSHKQQKNTSKKGKSLMSSTKKSQVCKATVSVKGKSRASSSSNNPEQPRRQSRRMQREALDVYDVRNMDQHDGSPVLPVQLVRNSSKRGRASTSKPVIIRAESATVEEDEDISEISIIGEVKGNYKPSTLKRKPPKDRSSKKVKKVRRHSRKKQEGKLQNPDFEGTEVSKHDEDSFVISNVPDKSKTKRKKKRNMSSGNKVADSSSKPGDCRSPPLEKEVSQTRVSDQSQPVVELADALEPIKNSRSGDLVKSGLKVQVTMLNQSEILKLKDKLNDGINKVSHPESGKKQQRKSLGRELQNAATVSNDLDKENKGAQWSPDSNRPSIQRISAAGSRRARPVSYKEPSIHSKMRRP